MAIPQSRPAHGATAPECRPVAIVFALPGMHPLPSAIARCAESERVPLPDIQVAYFACVASSVRFAGLRPHLTLHDLERFELRIESAIELVSTSASQK